MNTFFTFELRSWLRSPMPWIFMLLIALLTFGATVSDQISIGGGYGNVWKNSPYVAQNWYAVFSVLALLLVTSFLNSAAIRDFESKTDQIIFSKPVSKAGYYFGHFFGALLVSLLPMLGISLGMWLGVAANAVFEWIPANRFGPMEVQGHLSGLLVLTAAELPVCRRPAVRGGHQYPLHAVHFRNGGGLAGGIHRGRQPDARHQKRTIGLPARSLWPEGLQY
jgi:ABC-type transport system involved in multi-copper enzyme maturation permease subunit